jgi:hypothetical protein
LSMRRMNSGVSTTVTSGLDATSQCSALDYLTSRCGGKATGKPGPRLRARRAAARKTDLCGTRKIGRKLGETRGNRERRPFGPAFLTINSAVLNLKKVAGSTRLELATSGVTARSHFCVTC